MAQVNGKPWGEVTKYEIKAWDLKPGIISYFRHGSNGTGVLLAIEGKPEYYLRDGRRISYIETLDGNHINVYWRRK